MSSLDADWREITRKNYAAGADVEHPKSGLAQEFVIGHLEDHFDQRIVR